LNSREYIESGILEEYVMGRLSATEREEVEARAAEDEAVRAEIEAIELALERYAVLHGVQPPAGGLNAVLDKIEQTETPVANTGNAKPNNYRTGYWIAVAMIAILAGLASYFYFQNRDNSIENAELQQQLTANAVVCDSVTLENEILQSRLDFLRSDATQSTTMPGVEERAPSARTILYRNIQQQQAYLDVINLPTAPSDKRYQLWAIVDGNPVDMGVLETDLQPGAFLEVPYIENAQAYAITLEDLDDAEPAVPNLDELYVIGNVS